MDAAAIADLHRRAVEEFVRRARGVGPDQWRAATPCAEWDVRALVNHVVGEELWTEPLMGGATIEEVGDRFEGDVLGDSPLDAVERAAPAAVRAADESAMERTVHLSFGDVPGEEYAWQLTADHLVHAWDLAVATGGDPRFPDDLVTAVALWWAGREDLYRDAGAVGARADLPADATEQDRLIASFGRDPGWAPTGP